SGSVVSGFCTAVALSPAACNRAITSDQLDPSANSPCTRTTLRALGAGCAAAAVPWKRVLAAPAATMFTNVRRFIGYLGRRSSWLFMEVLLCVRFEPRREQVIRRARRRLVKNGGFNAHYLCSSSAGICRLAKLADSSETPGLRQRQR